MTADRFARLLAIASMCLPASSGCGARSQLLGGGEERVDDAGTSDAAQPPPVDSGVKPDCPSKLLEGAPTPMARYCSTRANRASVPAPSHPSLAWSLDLPTTKEPVAVVVDDVNRAYVTYDPTNDSSIVPREIAAVDPDGTVAWTVPIDSAIVGRPVLTADRRIVFVRASMTERFVVELDTGGAVVRETAVPELTFGNPAVGADGALYFPIDGLLEPARVMKFVDGQIEWTSDPLGEGLEPLVLDREGRILFAAISATSCELFVLNSAGVVEWTKSFEGYLVDGPAVAADDSIVMSFGLEQLSRSVVLVLEPSGEIRHRINLGATPQTAPSALALGLDGSMIVRTWDTTFGLDASGAVKWKRAAHPNLMYDVVVGSDGTIVLTSGSIVGLDPETGEERWSLAPPEPFWCADMGGLGVGGVLFGKQCDGSIFLARD